MTPETERRLAEYAAENCYTGEHLHALRMGAEIAGEELQALALALEALVAICETDGFDSAFTGRQLVMREARALIAKHIQHTTYNRQETCRNERN